MSILPIHPDWKVEKIECVTMEGERHRSAGANAKLSTHGKVMKHPVARVTIGGVSGFGWTRIRKEDAAKLIGMRAAELFDIGGAVLPPYRGLDFPLLDWLAKVQNKPVCELFARESGSADNYRVPCYDTSLYFDELHIADDEAAVRYIQDEAREGADKGHRNFKIKVGRGARHMPLAEGIRRDIAIIRAVREVAGPSGKVMIDANNGYNVNIAKQVLAETADCQVYWIEEAFHEDPVYYGDLKEWIVRENIGTLIGDGEGAGVSPQLLDWAKQGLIDVIQYDILDYTFSGWTELGRSLDRHGLKSSPHNYGRAYGNYVLSHLKAAVGQFQFVEWDAGVMPGIDDSGYRIEDGHVIVPNKPGFGLELDDAYFARLVNEKGWTLS
ncbi:o-succinylbenzoate synthase [Paenibacillus solanacearum]|uniref:O-succinylbenzoate synthase n=1 Tax=Paenibacillus solanacearum TaxID=2048548 RepID=A0A916JVV5_9BACL|nr:enolase C-terminal domain-like protein [Paenibacillus solanacearum]CAG7608949.1 o-succinylbenzoate synthase [Paenibacillus solanacearum]